MKMKIKKNMILTAIALVCVAAIGFASGQRGIAGYKQQNDINRKVMEVQHVYLGQLEGEIKALKAQLASRIPVSSPATVGVSTPGNDVQAVMEPADPDSQSQIDALKKRYEDTLVTYFLLRKCQKVNATDYHVIISALSQEMASLNAPGRLQYDILTSSQGTYNELYTGSKCDAATIDPLYTQYKIFVDTISTQFLPR